MRIVGFARVSSREQALEGYSLDVQEAAIRAYAKLNGAELVKLVRVAESAKRSEARFHFKDLLAFVEDRANRVDKVVFCQVDRATRSMTDAAKLEQLLDKYGVPWVAIRENMDSSDPAQEMAMTILAAAARHQVQAQARKIKHAVHARVTVDGLPPGKCSWGLQNVRDPGGKGRVVSHPVNGPNVPRIFELFDTNTIAVMELRSLLFAHGIFYSERQPKFSRSKLYKVLGDRTYLGEIWHLGKWWPGKFQALVDRALFDRVQERLTRKGRRASRDLLFSGNLVRCAHCGHAITGELKKQRYRYYRCSQYNAPDHPRVRLREEDLDAQVRALLEQLRIEDARIRDWFVQVLRTRSRQSQVEARSCRERLQCELAKVQKLKDELVDLRLRQEIESETFRRKQQEFIERERELRGALEREGDSQTERGEQAIRVFELTQHLSVRWVRADVATKRLLLDIVCLNLTLDGRNLVPTLRRPFDLLAEGLLPNVGRGERI